jgi:hypothetical protein
MGLKGAWQLTQYWLVSSFTAPHFVQYLLIKFCSGNLVEVRSVTNDNGNNPRTCRFSRTETKNLERVSLG